MYSTHPILPNTGFYITASLESLKISLFKNMFTFIQLNVFRTTPKPKDCTKTDKNFLNYKMQQCFEVFWENQRVYMYIHTNALTQERNGIAY